MPKFEYNDKIQFWGYPVGHYIHTERSKENVMHYAQHVQDLMDRYPNRHCNIFCTGSSGAIIAAMICTKLNSDRITISHIKKDGEKSHECGAIYKSASLNVIVDDFMASGKSIDRIMNWINKETHGIFIVDLLIVEDYVQCELEEYIETIICSN